MNVKDGYLSQYQYLNDERYELDILEMKKIAPIYHDYRSEMMTKLGINKHECVEKVDP